MIQQNDLSARTCHVWGQVNKLGCHIKEQIQLGWMENFIVPYYAPVLWKAPDIKLYLESVTCMKLTLVTYSSHLHTIKRIRCWDQQEKKYKGPTWGTPKIVKCVIKTESWCRKLPLCEHDFQCVTRNHFSRCLHISGLYKRLQHYCCVFSLALDIILGGIFWRSFVVKLLELHKESFHHHLTNG